MTTSRAGGRAAPVLVVALCGVLVTIEGYDLIMFGAIVPSLLREPGWGLTPAGVGLIGSAVYLGMLIGYGFCGALADRFGRRRLILVAMLGTALAAVACAVAAAPWQLALLRILVGLGCGALFPSGMALAKEYSPAGRTGLAITALTAGVPLGGVLASLLALPIIPALGWRPLPAIGGAVGLAFAALAWRLLPESDAYLRSRSDPAAAGAAPSPARALLAPRFRTVTLVCAAVAFFNLVSWYGMSTWLTRLMELLDFPLSSALGFTLTLNLAAIVGSFGFAVAGDRWRLDRVAIAASLLTAAALALLSVGGYGVLVLLLLIAMAGVGGQSALNLLNAWTADHYPTRLRATAIGVVNGAGRPGAVLAPALGGWVLGAGLGPKAVFYCFATASVLSAVLLAVLVVVTGRRAGQPSSAMTRAR